MKYGATERAAVVVNRRPPVIERASLSTMWAMGRFEQMADFARHARGLGFGQIEVNYEVGEEMLAELTELSRGGTVRISSVHDPATLPEGLTLRTLPQLSSLDEDERSRAVALSRAALGRAAALGAAALVVHPGRVEGLRARELALRELLKAGGRGDAYEERTRELRALRSNLATPYLEALASSIEVIASRGREVGVAIALECRYHFDELPLPHEARVLIDEFRSLGVGYWHDIGHAHVLDFLGLVDADEWLGLLGGDLLGLHLHDARGLHDHDVPGTGDVAFGPSRAYLRPDTAVVCEFGRWNTPLEVRTGLLHLADLGYF